MKTAIVTGGASGIGLAAGKELLERGWRVALIDRDGVALAAAASTLPADRTSTHELDITDEAAVTRAVDTIAGHGELRGLVNSAGIAADKTLSETTAELFRHILEVNVIGSFLMVRAAAPHMEKADGGAIVNIASVSGMRGNVGRVAYGASKGGVIIMTQVMAVELAAAKIRVNVISPGPVDTPIVRQMGTSVSRDMWTRQVPMRRFGEPEEIARGIAFLLDDAQSSYITGQTLAIDGGFIAGGLISRRDDRKLQ
jgi:NAD(P)-dependent dehydrogenase (short-subunit alcohol dehydrogenase family)